MALIDLPPAIAICAAFAASLAHVSALPRWFSFLVPFYAMVLAHGVLEIAERFRFNRDLVVMLVAGGVMQQRLFPELASAFWIAGPREFGRI